MTCVNIGGGMQFVHSFWRLI